MCAAQPLAREPCVRHVFPPVAFRVQVVRNIGMCALVRASQPCVGSQECLRSRSSRCGREAVCTLASAVWHALRSAVIRAVWVFVCCGLVVPDRIFGFHTVRVRVCVWVCRACCVLPAARELTQIVMWRVGARSRMN